jgi:hemerythrin-like metal-binding protein
MAQLEWDDYMSVGVPEIDKQHRDLIAAINRLYEIVMKGDLGEMRAARQRALDDLDEYVRHHFTSEEKFMEDISYPGLAEHRHMHKDFARRIEGFRTDLRNGDLLLTSELMKTMLQWFRDHFLDEDGKYAEFHARGGD